MYLNGDNCSSPHVKKYSMPWHFLSASASQLLHSNFLNHRKNCSFENRSKLFNRKNSISRLTENFHVPTRWKKQVRALIGVLGRTCARCALVDWEWPNCYESNSRVFLNFTFFSIRPRMAHLLQFITDPWRKDRFHQLTANNARRYRCGEINRPRMVHRATDLGMLRSVAIKKIKRETDDNAVCDIQNCHMPLKKFYSWLKCNFSFCRLGSAELWTYEYWPALCAG